MPNDAPLRDPSTLFFQSDHVRRAILAAYWAVILLALPLWWYTTSIERLSLPTARVAAQAQIHLRIPVRLFVDAGPESPSLASSLRTVLDSRITDSPQHWKPLDVRVDYSQTGMLVQVSVTQLNGTCLLKIKISVMTRTPSYQVIHTLS